MSYKRLTISLIILYFILITPGCGGAGLTPTFPEEQEEESVVGTIMVPEGSKSRDLSDWTPLPGATVTLTDSADQTHTVITDENGNYSFFQVAAGSNYIITATGEVKGNTIVLKDIVPQLEVGEKYDAGTADAESTALALVVEDILDKDIEPDLDTIQQSTNYHTLVDEVLIVLEQNNNIMTDPEIKNSVYNSLDELIPTQDIITFCNQNWELKNGYQAPGENYYSNSINNVWLDDQDRLHLKIIKRDNKWYCAEVLSQSQGWGYGKYTFDVETVIMKVEDEDGKISYINDLDKNAVVGLYTYDSNTTHKSHNELDIEFAKWGNPNNDIGNFVVWYDTTESGNKRNFNNFPIDVGGNYVYRFKWTASNIIFYSSGMTSCPLYPESFQYKEGDSIVGTSGEGYGYIPIPNKERVLMNIWLNGGNPPADNNIKEIEVIVNSFQFEEESDEEDFITLNAWTITGYDPYCIMVFGDEYIPDRSIFVYWSKISSAEGYKVYRSVNGSNSFDLVYSGDGIFHDSLNIGVEEIGWFDFNTNPGNSYSYKVSYVKNGQESTPSEIVTRSVWLPECSLKSPTDYNPEDPNDQPVIDPNQLLQWNSVNISYYPYQGKIFSGMTEIWVCYYNTPYPVTGQAENLWGESFNNLITSSTRFKPNNADTPLIPGADHIYAWETRAVGYDNAGDVIAMSWSGARHFFYMGPGAF